MVWWEEMTARFTVVSAPLDQRLGAGLASGLQEALHIGAHWQNEMNKSLHDEDLGEKANRAVQRLVVPSGLPFVLLCLIVAILAARELLIRIAVRQLIKEHETAELTVSQKKED